MQLFILLSAIIFVYPFISVINGLFLHGSFPSHRAYNFITALYILFEQLVRFSTYLLYIIIQNYNIGQFIRFRSRCSYYIVVIFILFYIFYRVVISYIVLQSCVVGKFFNYCKRMRFFFSRLHKTTTRWAFILYYIFVHAFFFRDVPQDAADFEDV